LGLDLATSARAVAVEHKRCAVCSRVFRPEATTCPDDGAVLVVDTDDDLRAPRLGQVVGSYRLLRVLGEGGVGTVYEAEHIRLGRKMALKLLHRDVVNQEMVTRFFNEARAVNEIRHPNIIDVEDFVTTPTGESYMLMELLVGEDLRSVISRDGKVDPERVARIGAHVANALAAVHQVGIIHRDLKPDNVFLIQRGGKEVAKLLDFGIAKFTEDRPGVTRAGMTMGTPQYMAPEQIMSGSEVGPSSDIYALGMVMYEALTGAPAFNSSNMANILRAQCFEVVVPPSQRRTEPIPPVIEAAVMKCLEKDASHRFATAADLRDALHAETPVAYTQATAVGPGPERAPVRASPRRTVQLLPALAMVAVALAVHLWPRTDAAPEVAATPTVTSPPAALGATPAPPPRRSPTTIDLPLSSEPQGAALFLGAERRPLGTAPLTASLPISHAPVSLTARFDDGREVTETLVPDRPRGELVFVAPKAKPVGATPAIKRPRAATKPVAATPAIEDRDGTLDPFTP